MHEIKLKNKRILHFFQDEKVVNDAIINFETVYPGENLYIVLSKDGKVGMVSEHPNTLFLSYHSKQLKSIIKDVNSFGEIICHSLWHELSCILNKMNHPNITWVIWGADLYETMLYRKGYKLYFDETTLFKVRAQKMPVPLYRLLVGIRDYYYYKTQSKAIEKLHSLCVLDEDYELLRKYYIESDRFSPICKGVIYYPIEKMLDEETKNSFVSGKDVWVNNAATYNGNHIEVFNRLRKINYKGTVHVPLSYGIPKWAKYVESEGYNILGDMFDPMMSYLPRDEYYKKFLSSNSFVFGHLRQCANGNIIVALYLGAKVFLFKDNPLYHYYKKIGIIIFTIDDELTNESISSPLPDEIRQKNRDILLKIYSYENALKLLKDSF